MGYDADQRVIKRLEEKGTAAVIPPKRNRTFQREYDKDLYKARHLRHEFLCPTQTISRNRDTL
ncbi:MAG: hypothetical protein F6K49_30855 [Moorea sp. SIO3I6]|nr:hypothetical protein [Moorena sp. SIO3I6]NEP26210.1 hypothetical protein [Moorena sp. SIO3I6]